MTIVLKLFLKIVLSQKKSASANLLTENNKAKTNFYRTVHKQMALLNEVDILRLQGDTKE